MTNIILPIDKKKLYSSQQKIILPSKSDFKEHLKNTKFYGI